MAITQVMGMTGMIQWGMRQSAEVTNQLMSVERVLEYTVLSPEPNLRDKGLVAGKKKSKKIKQEEDNFVDPPENWPSAGTVEFKHVFLKYSEDDPPVIKGLTLKIKPSEKVGFDKNRTLFSYPDYSLTFELLTGGNSRKNWCGKVIPHCSPVQAS